jgi:uncharacterized protein
MRNFINQQLYPGEFLLHQKYAKSEMLLELVWTHCNIVVDIALDLLDNQEFDKSGLPREYVIQAGLLFDIGVYLCGGYEWMPGQEPADRPYVQHGVVGAWILQQEGYAPQIIQVAHSHAGVGISHDDIRNYGLQLPEADYLPYTMLQMLLAYASKFHSKTPKFKDRNMITASLSRFGKQKVERFEELEAMFGTPNLEKLEAKYQGWHQSFLQQIQQIQQANTTQPTSTAILNSAGIPKQPTASAAATQ